MPCKLCFFRTSGLCQRLERGTHKDISINIESFWTVEASLCVLHSMIFNHPNRLYSLTLVNVLLIILPFYILTIVFIRINNAIFQTSRSHLFALNLYVSFAQRNMRVCWQIKLFYLDLCTSDVAYSCKSRFIIAYVVLHNIVYFLHEPGIEEIENNDFDVGNGRCVDKMPDGTAVSDFIMRQYFASL